MVKAHEVIEDPKGLLSFAEVKGMQEDTEFLIDGNDTIIRVERDGTERTFNETTGRYVSTRTFVYEGPSVVYPVVFRRSRQEIITEEDIRVRVYRGNIPMGKADIRMKDIVTIVSSVDEEFVGKEMRVIDILYEGYPGLRRFDMVDVAEDHVGLFTTPVDA